MDLLERGCKVHGIVTMENVLERILQLDILDEEDKDLARMMKRRPTILYPERS